MWYCSKKCRYNHPHFSIIITIYIYIYTERRCRWACFSVMYWSILLLPKLVSILVGSHHIIQPVVICLTVYIVVCIVHSDGCSACHVSTTHTPGPIRWKNAAWACVSNVTRYEPVFLHYFFRSVLPPSPHSFSQHEQGQREKLFVWAGSERAHVVWTSRSYWE